MTRSAKKLGYNEQLAISSLKDIEYRLAQYRRLIKEQNVRVDDVSFLQRVAQTLKNESRKAV